MARVLISMPDEFLNRIDRIAEVEQRTRSELIREALRSYIRGIEPRMQNHEKNANILENMVGC